MGSSYLYLISLRPQLKYWQGKESVLLDALGENSGPVSKRSDIEDEMWKK